ncbi:MAG: 3-dehydroquinate synthase [Paludibacteraceae bacterium]|nr:3-dehydroquinate synthase [Paludibacteraceae bacterium]
MSHYDPDQVVWIMDEHVRSFSLFSRGSSVVVPWYESISEDDKSLQTVERIWDLLLEKGITRRGLLVAVGGGVLTDVAGFAAATYRRGIDWVAVPTTLLAMVDASTGGKTGINYKGMKNMIGAFYPPVETIIWSGWLETLPAKEMLSGFGEMLKTGLVTPPALPSREENASLWEALMRYDLDTMPIESLTPLIKACVEAKERIVAADPKEEGLRKVLNFGHTFGHALEEAPLGPPLEGGKKERIPHGYAVLYGMIAELYLSVVKLGCPREPLQQLTQMVIHYYGKPECKCSDRGKLIELMKQDKKNEHAGEINCTLIRGIGEPVINQVITEAEAEEAWEYLFSL